MQIITDELPPSSPLEILSVATEIFLFIVVLGLFIHFLNRHLKSEKLPDTSSMKPSLFVLTISLLLIALFAPSNLNIYPLPGYSSPYTLIAMSWELAGNFVLSFTYFLVGLPFMFLRLVFVFQVYKYFLGLTSRKRVVISGILAELQMFLVGLFLIPVGQINPNIAVMIPVPIPILLLVGYALVHFIPRSQEVSEKVELEKRDDWLENEEETHKQ